MIVLSAFCILKIKNVDIDMTRDIIQLLEGQVGIMLPGFFLLYAVSMIYQLLMYYLSISIGQLFSGNKIAGAIVGYLLISFVLYLLIMGIAVVGGLFAGIVEMNFMKIEAGMTIYLSGLSILMLIVSVAAYFMICHLLGKKLNLN